MTDARAEANVIIEVVDERIRQDVKWGQQDHPDGRRGTREDFLMARAAKERCQLNTPASDNWRDILDEEVAEAYDTHTDSELRAELIQVAAVAVAWVEAIDRRSHG